MYFFNGSVIFHLEKAMAPHSSILAWKIPWMEEPGGLQSMGSLESDTTERLHSHFSFHALEKEVATHSSVLVWRIPGTEEPAIYGVAQSRTRLKWLSSSSNFSPGEGNGNPPQHCLEIPWTEEPGGLQSLGSLRVRHDWVTSLSRFPFMHWRRQWQPTPVFLPGESQGRGAWWAAVYGVAQSDTTEVT